MNITSCRRIVVGGVTALLLSCPGLAQTPGQPVEYPKAQLEVEQRVMTANVKDANYHIDRGVKAAGAGLSELAKVSLLRATGRVAQVDDVMKGHPERIERVAMVLFTSREEVRKPLRASYEKIRDEFGALEQAMYAFRKDMLRKGIFGEELKQQIAVLDAVTKLLPEIEKKDPAKAKQIRDLIEQINQALASGDNATAERLIKQLQALLVGAGYGENIEAAKAKINADAPGGGGSSGGGGGGGTTAIPGVGGSATQSGSAVALSIPGKPAVPPIPGTLSPDGRFIDSPEFGRIDLGTMRTLPDGTVVAMSDRGLVYLGPDGRWRLLAGAKLNPDGTVTTADGRTGPLSSLLGGGGGASGGGRGGSAPFSGKIPDNVTVVGPDGKRITVGPEWKDGEQKGVSKDYIDVNGGMLDSETRVTRKIVESTGNVWKVQETPGERRNWNFTIRVGAENKASGSISFPLTVDGGGPTGFTIKSWEAIDSSGTRASVAPAAGKPEAVVTFTKGGRYETFASGETEWGTPFRIKGPVIDAYP